MGTDGTLRGDLTPTDVARQLFAFNAGYTLFIRGNNTPPDLSEIPAFDAAPAHQREIYVNLAKTILNKRDITPPEVHEEWVNLMKRANWTRGTLNEHSKTHPLLVPYADLEPQEQLRAVQFITLVQGVMVQHAGTGPSQRQTAGVGAVIAGY